MISCCLEYDGDPCSVGSERIRKANKEHVCEECDQVIRPGELYEYATWCFDGSWGDFKTCLVCATVRKDHARYGYIYGDLWESLAECYGSEVVNGDWDDDEDEDPMGPPPEGRV